MKRVLFVSTIILTLVGVFAIIMSRRSAPAVTQTSANATYRLGPIRQFEARAPFPYVWVRPDTPAYALVSALEVLRLNTQTYSHLLLGEKRISELMRWGDTMKVEQTIPIDDSSAKTVSALLKKLEEDSKNDIETRLGVYDSWELMAARYVQRFTQYVFPKNTITQDERLRRKLQLTQYVTGDQQTILTSISRMDIPENQKAYLARLWRHIFTYINSSVALQRTDPTRTYITYLMPTDNASDLRYFDIYFDRATIPREETAQIIVGNNTYSPSAKSNDLYLLFSRVTIPATITYFDLAYKKNSPIPLADFTTKRIHHTVKYSTNISIPKIHQQMDILVDTSFYATTSAYMQIYAHSQVIDGVTNSLIPYKERAYSKIVFREDLLRHVEDGIRTDEQFTTSLSASLITNEGANVSQSVNYLQVTPLYNLPATLVGKQQSATTHNNNNNNNNTYTKAFIGALIVVLFLCAYVLFSYLIKKLGKQNKKILSHMRDQFVQNAALINTIPIVLSMGILVDILIVPSRKYTVTYGLCFLWTYVLVRYRVRPKTIATVTLVGFVFGTANYVIGLISIAEKAMLWAYVGMISGLLTSVFAPDVKTEKGIALSVQAKLHTIGQSSILRPLINHSQQFITRLLSNKYSLKQIGITVCAAMCFVAISMTATGYYYFRPFIQDVSPNYAYTSNVVLIQTNHPDDPFSAATRLNSTIGYLPTTLKDDALILHIPSNTNPQPIDIWIEKQLPFFGQIITLKSNKRPLYILGENSTNNEKDNFIRQLPYVNEEALRLNGY